MQTARQCRKYLHQKPWSGSRLITHRDVLPLEDSKSPGAFEGALRTIIALQDRNLKCGIALVGWSLLEGSTVGQGAWHQRVSPEQCYSQSLRSMAHIDEIPMSALFEVVQSKNDILHIQGSPVLVQKASEEVQGPVTTKHDVTSP
jgi:hypothetical protein